MSPRNQATSFTEQANRALLDQLNWDDVQSFEDAGRGFIASLDDPVIAEPGGRAVWDVSAYPFLAEESAPPSVNPSLWRQSRLNALFHGLFQVTEGIYQIRGFDLSVMSIIETDGGYVVVDPLISTPDVSRRHGAGLQTSGPQTGSSGHLYAQPYRSLGRRQGRNRRGRRQGGQGQGDCAGALPGARHQRKRHRRQRHEPPRQLHVRQPVAQGRAGAGRSRLGPNDVHAVRSH